MDTKTKMIELAVFKVELYSGDLTLDVSKGIEAGMHPDRIVQLMEKWIAQYNDTMELYYKKYGEDAA